MIIVEGSDGVGKTQLCHTLCKELGFMYSHMGRLPDDWRYPESYRVLIGGNIVQDRFHMSELVYGGVLRDGPQLSAIEYAMIDAWLIVAGAVTVVVVAPPERIQERWRDSEQMYSLDDALRVNERFREIAARQYLYGGWAPILNVVYAESQWPSQSANLIRQIIKVQGKLAELRNRLST